MTYVYDVVGTDRSDLVILDAGDLDADPVATIQDRSAECLTHCATTPTHTGGNR